MGYSTKTNSTILECVLASGFAIPPMVIYNWKNLTPELTRGEIPGTMYGLSASGWIDSELFRMILPSFFTVRTATPPPT